MRTKARQVSRDAEAKGMAFAILNGVLLLLCGIQGDMVNSLAGGGSLRSTRPTWLKVAYLFSSAFARAEISPLLRLKDSISDGVSIRG